MKTLLVFSHLRWNFVFQRPQHLFSRLAKHYNVIFVEEPMRTDAAPHLYQNEVLPGVTVLVPHTNEDGWGFNDQQVPVIGDLVSSWIEHVKDQVGEYGVWFYTPQALPLLDFFSPELVIFDVMDELSAFAGAPPELKEREKRLLELADVVIAGGPSLHRAKTQHREDTILLPSSVDAQHYSPKRAAQVEAETHVGDALEHDIPHPRLGFFGVIDERLDVELVEKIADANPEWHLIMVGPVVKIDPAILPQRPNIHWLGQQPYDSLPMIVQSWDVCLLPFALNESTKFISPTKTLEYMAAEKPIVSTAIHDVVELYGSVVKIGETHDEFIDAIGLILRESASDRADRIASSLKIVERNSWDRAAEVVHEAIQKRLK